MRTQIFDNGILFDRVSENGKFSSMTQYNTGITSISINGLTVEEARALIDACVQYIAQRKMTEKYKQIEKERLAKYGIFI
jgi:LPS O-antigen subunit length determinant protein (WzzB/FepE family)